jgi:large subunit ribosomal protein L1
MPKPSKHRRLISEGLNRERTYDLDEAIRVIKQWAVAKFDETIEIAMNLGIDPRHADQMVRGVVNLPNGIGKQVRVAVFAKGDVAEEALSSGADIVGADDLVKEIQEGRMDFDRCIATPDMMGIVARLGKILGPRGLMPNPKLGTVTTDISSAIKAAKSGAVEFRAEKTGIIHAGVGKASFADTALSENVCAFITAILRAKPNSTKGVYLKKISLSSTMGPSIKIDLLKLSIEGIR